jgi:hypothetical protein
MSSRMGTSLPCRTFELYELRSREEGHEPGRLAASRIGVSSTAEQGSSPVGRKSGSLTPVELSDFQRECTADVRRRSDHAKA